MKKSIFVLTASLFTLVTIASSHAQTKTDNKTNPKTTTNADSTTVKKNIPGQDTTKNTAQSKLVGGAQMLPSKDIVDNASQSKDHTTLVSAIKAAGLVEVLKGAGPFTVFAPTNDAFAKLPAGSLETLTQPANKEKLAGVLTYHVVPGKLTSKDLATAVAKGNGSATLTTVEGDNLIVSINAEKNLQITDANGNIALVTMFDVEQLNGIIHVINNVLLPKE